MTPEDGYRPTLSSERVERLRRWHEDVSAELSNRGAQDVEYLGLRLHVPEQVFAPTPVSDLLGHEVLAAARPGLRVLDMGCGAGANAILAARQADDVLGVDVNPFAVEASRANAARNGVADRTRFAGGDLFDGVDGDFDLIFFDPPFRWFRPQTLLERAVTDENYATLTRFMRELPGRLRPHGAALVSFGTSGDTAYLDQLVDESALDSTAVAERSLPVRGEVATYFVRRLTNPVSTGSAGATTS